MGMAAAGVATDNMKVAAQTMVMVAGISTDSVKLSRGFVSHVRSVCSSKKEMPPAHARCGSTGQSELRAVMEERVQRARREATRFMEDAVQVTSVTAHWSRQSRRIGHVSHGALVTPVTAHWSRQSRRTVHAYTAHRVRSTRSEAAQWTHSLSLSLSLC